MTRFIFIYSVIFFIGCSGSHELANVHIIKIDKKDFQIPAGVDSSIAHNAKIKAERLFVNTRSEQNADSLNKYYYDYLEITIEIYKKLEEKKEKFREIRQAFQELSKSFEGKDALSLEDRRKYQKQFEQIAEDSLTISIVTSLLDYYLDYCSENFEKAYELNPYDLNSLNNLAVCSSDRGVIFQDTVANRKAIRMLMKVLNHNRGVASVYKEIGNNYFVLKEWKKSYENFFKAHQVYVITSIFDNPRPDTSERFKKGNIPPHVKPDEYYDYLFWKGRSEIKIHEADSALATLKKALYLSPSKEDSTAINYLVKEYIQWDDGNIYAAEQKEIIEDSLIHGNYEWAKNAYIELLPRLNTNKARDNITWKLARIEFSNLNQPEEAANRLYNLVMHADTSKKKSSIYKPPADSLYKVYFKDCGTLLFGLGDKYLNEGFHEKAKQFFVKDTTFEWSGRGKVFLPIAQLVTLEVPENLPPQERLNMLNERRLKLLNRAKEFIENFTEREIDQLYRSLSLIFQSQRNQVMLQNNYREWNAVKARHKKSAS